MRRCKLCDRHVEAVFMRLHLLFRHPIEAEGFTAIGAPASALFDRPRAGLKQLLCSLLGVFW